MDPCRIRSYLQVACAGLGFEIGEIWWTSNEHGSSTVAAIGEWSSLFSKGFSVLVFGTGFLQGFDWSTFSLRHISENMTSLYLRVSNKSAALVLKWNGILVRLVVRVGAVW